MVVRCDCRWGKAYQILILKCQKCHSDCNKTQVSTSYLGNNSVRRSDGKPPQCGYVLLTKGSKKSVAFCNFFKTSLEKKIKIPPPPSPRWLLGEVSKKMLVFGALAVLRYE